MQKFFRIFFTIGSLAASHAIFAQSLGADGKPFYVTPQAIISDPVPVQATNSVATSPVTELSMSTKVLSSSSVNFTWKSPTSEAYKVYVIQRSTDTKNFVNVGQVWATELKNNQLNFTDTAIAEGTQAVQYRVIAYTQDARMKLYTPVQVNLKRQE